MNDNSTQSRWSPGTILCTESTIKQAGVSRKASALEAEPSRTY